jgi:hypothetical protein
MERTRTKNEKTNKSQHMQKRCVYGLGNIHTYIHTYNAHIICAKSKQAKKILLFISIYACMYTYADFEVRRSVKMGPKNEN